MNIQGEQLTIAELADALGKPISLVGDIFQDTLSGLLTSKTVCEHVKTGAAMSKLRRQIKRLRVRVDGDDEVTLAEIADVCGIPVEHVSTYFFVRLHQRTPMIRAAAS
ncbi:AraC-like DNA-binding protein [Bradyrhizobium sp. USDA 4011]